MRASLAQARITHHHPLSDGATVGLATEGRTAYLVLDEHEH